MLDMAPDKLPPRALAQLAAVTDGTLRVGPLTGIPQLLRELGRDPDMIFREVGVDLGLLDDPERSIGFADLGRLLAHCAVRTECPHFGLLAGQRRGLEAMGLVGMLVEHSPDVGTALNNMVLHLHLHDRGAVPFVTVDGRRALFGYAIYQPVGDGARHIYDAAVAIGFNALRSLCGRGWRPTEVHFSHTRPVDPEPYKQFFGAPLRFDSEHTAIAFSSDCMSCPLPGADAKLRRLLEERVLHLEHLGAGDLVAQMRRVVRNLLLGGRGSLDQVAQVFSIHRRTLNRRMREHGLTVQGLVEEVRYDIACQLLRETDLKAVEIAAVLDYADAASFTRAFRRWSGTTPSTWRAGQRSV